MTEIHITSLQNQQVKAWRALKEGKGRAAQRLFLAEGDHLTGEALNGHAAALLVANGAAERYREHVEHARRARLPIYFLTEHVFASLCDTKTPQGVAALCPLPVMEMQPERGLLRLAALDGVQDPGNVGTILRTLDAAGFDALLMDRRTADPYSPKALRASMGAVFRIPAIVCDLPLTLAALSVTHDLYAGALDGTPFFERKREKKGVCVIIGNEGAGISAEVYAIPGIRRVKLPMNGGAESLNASVAGAIMIYDIVRCGE